MSILLSFPFSAAAPDAPAKSNLSAWFVWILLIVIVALVALVLIRDKPLREKVLSVFRNIGKKFTRFRLRRKFKSGQLAKDEVLQRLGQAAWKAGHKPKTSAEAIHELGVLEDAIKAKSGVIEKNEAEAARIKQAQAEFVQAQQAKIKEQEDKARPHREELARVQTKLRDVENKLAETDKSIRDAEAEKRRAEGEIAKVEADAALAPDQKQARANELRARAQAAIEQKAAAEPKLDPLRGEQTSLKKTVSEIQTVIDGHGQTIGTLTEKQKEKTRAAEAQTTELAKKNDGLRSEVKEMEKKQQPHWLALGRDIHGRKLSDPALADLNAEIDKIDQNMRDIEERLKALGE